MLTLFIIRVSSYPFEGDLEKSLEATPPVLFYNGSHDCLGGSHEVVPDLQIPSNKTEETFSAYLHVSSTADTQVHIVTCFVTPSSLPRAKPHSPRFALLVPIGQRACHSTVPFFLSPSASSGLTQSRPPPLQGRPLIGRGGAGWGGTTPREAEAREPEAPRREDGTSPAWPRPPPPRPAATPPSAASAPPTPAQLPSSRRRRFALVGPGDF